MKKWRNVALIGALAFALTGCLFNLSGFVILDTSLTPGGTTTARFTVQPYSEEPLKAYPFVLLGVDDAAQLNFGKATWGANGEFRGPLKMDPSPGFAATLDADGGCQAAGLDFGSVVGQFSWRGYVTPMAISNRGDVNHKATVDVAVKAKASAARNTNSTTMAITGLWDDDGDGVVESDDDVFLCTGNATASVYVN